MNTSRFNNSELLKKVEQTFNVSIHQDTNYSDQSDNFYRFDVCKDKNSPVIGRIICINGNFEGGAQRNFDGTYSPNELLNNIADFMNKNNA